jgi:two-component system, NtrC family, sensor kinase
MTLHDVAAVLDGLPYPVYWKDLDGRYLGANAAYLAARGLPPGTVLLGLREVDLPVDDVFTSTLPRIERGVLESGEPATGAQSLSRPPSVLAGQRDGDGQRDAAKILLTVAPLRAADGTILGVVGAGADVFDLDDIGRTVSYTSRLESIGRLAANMAHRINTPVQFITDNTRFVAEGATTLLRSLQAVHRAVTVADDRSAAERLASVAEILDGVDLDFLDDELPPALLHSLEGLSQIAQLVSTLTDFSRAEGAMAEAILNDAVDNAVHMTLHEWGEIADLRLNLDPEVGKIPCYEGELRQAITNVISNAAQAIAARRAVEPGAPAGVITVSTRRDGDVVVLVVRDNGCGMDDDEQTRIFDPFFTTKPFGQATGLGLSLAHVTIVSRHRGAIEVETAIGKGSTFTITLPVREGDGEAG